MKDSRTALATMRLGEIKIDEIMTVIYPVLKDTFGYVPLYKGVAVCEAIKDFIENKVEEENNYAETSVCE